MAIWVSVDNFVRAETDRMFADIQRDAGGVNQFRHNREPAPIDRQTVIRLNRDTLYSFAITDLATPAVLTLPEAGGRYMSAMVVNSDHLINQIFHSAGPHELTQEQAGSRYVLVAIRTLVDPVDPDDVAAVAALQDQIILATTSAEPFEYPDYDKESFDKTRTALLSLGSGLRGFDRMFGTRDEIDPVRHLLGTAGGWGGLPTSEASYVAADPQLPPGEYELRFADVPVEAFWSVSVYNAEGFFEPNPENLYSVNSVTGVRDDDGSITVRFTADGSAGHKNAIVTPQGWNYLVRLYRPRPEFLDGSWQLPALTPVAAG
jgi:hypothetical protein